MVTRRNEALQPIAHRQIEARGVKFYVSEAGSGPFIVLLHGMMSSMAVWHPVMRALADKFRCVAFDQRGHGLNSKPADGYTAQDYAGDVLALIEALGAGPAVVVGHSLGARNAIVAAGMNQTGVKAVVAIDYVPFVEKEVLDGLEARVAASDRLYTSRAEIESDIHARLPKLPPEAVRLRANTLFGEADGGFRQLASAEAMVLATRGLREDFTDAFRSLACPALILCGAQSNVVSEHALEATRGVRPDIPFVRVPDADHFVIEEAPSFCASAIADFAGR